MTAIHDFYAGAPSASSPAGTLAFDETNRRAYVHNGTAWQRMGPLTGNALFVDQVHGDDATGQEGDPSKPFLTLNAAAAAAGSGDTIFLSPGNHALSAELTIATGYQIVGAGIADTAIRLLSQTANKTAITVTSGGAAISNCTVVTTSATSGVELIGVKVTPNTLSNTLLHNVLIWASSAGGGAAHATGLLIQGQTLGDDEAVIVAKNCEIKAVSSGTGNARGVLKDTSAGASVIANSRILANGGTSNVAAQMNIGGGTLRLENCVLDGTTADVTRSAGTLELGNCILRHNTSASTTYTSTNHPVLRNASIWVDPVRGVDATALRGDPERPYALLATAIAAASADDVIYLTPGTHTLAAALTVTPAVTIVGAGSESTTITMSVSATTTMLTLGANVQIRDCTIALDGTSTNTYIAVLISGLANAGPTLRNCAITSTGSSSGTSHGVVVRAADGNGNPNIQDCTITISGGSIDAASRSLLMDTSTGTCVVQGTFIKSNKGGAEINIASGNLHLTNCIADGTTYDVSQTAGTLTLTGTRLVNNSSNLLSFTIGAQAGRLTWGHIGAVTSNATRFLYPGNGLNSVLEIKWTVSTPFIMQKIRLFCTAAPGSTDTTAVTIRKSGVDTSLTCTVTATATEASELATAVSFAVGDEVSCKIVTSLNLATTDPQVSVESY